MQVQMRDQDTHLTLDPFIFDEAYNEGLIHQVVTSYLNKARSGNSAQKTRAEVRGGGKKPWKQKGTGRARAGTIRSPLWRSGGVIFAAKKRDYAQKVNKKMYRKAICGILSELRRTENLHIVSQFNCDTHKTKDFIAKMKGMNIENALLISTQVGANEYLASRNLEAFSVCDVEGINPLNIVMHEHVIITADAVRQLEEQLL